MSRCRVLRHILPSLDMVFRDDMRGYSIMVQHLGYNIMVQHHGTRSTVMYLISIPRGSLHILLAIVTTDKSWNMLSIYS